jgi:RNA polymerase sigma factor (sigma-70 family)
VEASAFPASVGLTRKRIAIGASLLRIRSDEQLVTLFREGNDDAFRVIHDRYRARIYAYARQMLAATSQDPEDAVQEIFMRAYHGLRASNRKLALRAWLYRVAHNRCIDDLRRPHPIMISTAEPMLDGPTDPVQKVEQRDALRRLILDVQRLPEQQRSALLMRELSGMPYADVSAALGVTVPAVKSLLVRARVSLAQASEARNTECAEIRAGVILAHDRGVRTSGLARRHMRDCPGCREFRAEVRGVSRRLGALAPTLGPFGLLANLLGWGGGGGATAGTTAVTGTAAAAGGAAGTSATSAGLFGAGHVVTLLAAAVVTAGGAVEIQKALVPPTPRHAHHQRVAPRLATAQASAPSPSLGIGSSPASATQARQPTGVTLPDNDANSPVATDNARATASAARLAAAEAGGQRPITEILDPDMYLPPNPNAAPPTTADGNPASGTATGTSGTTASGVTTGSGTGSTSGSDTGSTTGSTGGGSTTTTSGSGPGTSGSGSSTATGSSDASTAPTTGLGASTSVGRSTTAAGRGRVVSFLRKRHARHR